MAHPYQDIRQHKQEKSRADHMVRAYAAGGGVLKSDDLPDGMLKSGETTSKAKPTGSKIGPRFTGVPAKQRLDRPKFAAGGRANGKATNVNVIVAPQPSQAEAAPAMPPPIAPPVGPNPPPPMAPPPGAAPAGPGAPPTGLPIRKSGGRVGAKADSEKNGTKVTHTPGKNDLGMLSSKLPAAMRASGGKVEGAREGARSNADTNRMFGSAITSDEMNQIGRKSGGRTPAYPIKDGAGGGKGRMQKITAYGA